MVQLNNILGYENLKIFQDDRFFSFSLDSIILSNYSSIRLRDKKIVDFCTGNGIVPIILSQRCGADIYGVDIQKELIDLANKSIEYDNLVDRIHFICQDVISFSLEHLNEFDLVLCNPPYFKINANSSFNKSYNKMIARHEILINLSQICNCANRVLKDNGIFSMVHRSDRLIEVITTLRQHNLEPKSIKFIHNNCNSDSTLVLIQSQKCGKVGLKILKPLFLRNIDGSFTVEYRKLQEEIVYDSK